MEAATAENKKGVWPVYFYLSTNKFDPQDIAISEKMANSWAQFAKIGNLNIEEEGQVNWPIYSLKDEVMRSFSEKGETIKGMLKDRVDYQPLHLKKLYISE
ncbi:MAG TPA: hypothetical protein DCW35_05580 [Polynucleobacter sp.]|nr:carboxylesterase family protein [Polynucleobacter necessarius]HAT39442.1 hypothetical protein [Polynucleobacter sp.]